MLPPTYEPAATGHVPEMLELIAELIERGHAYPADDRSGDVYFDVRSWPAYGELTRQKVADMEAAEDADLVRREEEASRHAELLRRSTSDEKLAEAVLVDYKTAELTEKEMAMLDYAVLLTKDATLIAPQNQENLRSHGFNDTAILQITLIAAWFNYINRVADALGIGRENEKENT